MNSLRYIYFLSSFLLVSLVAGCGKRKPNLLTIPQKLLLERNVSVGARVCNWSDYQMFLGAHRAYFPFNSKLIQIYIKNDSQKRYKFSGKNIQRMSPEIFQTHNGVWLKMYCPLSSKIAGALLFNVPVSVVLGTSTAVLFSIILHYTCCVGRTGTGCPESFLLLMTIPALTITCYVGLSAYIIYKIISKFNKQKIRMKEKIRKNLFALNSRLDLKPQSQTHKVFFVSERDFKNLKKDGILLFLIDRQSKEKLIFSVPLS